MLEYIIIFLLIAFALSMVTWRIKRIIKGDTACSSCSNDCNQCGVIPSMAPNDQEIQ